MKIPRDVVAGNVDAGLRLQKSEAERCAEYEMHMYVKSDVTSCTDATSKDSCEPCVFTHCAAALPVRNCATNFQVKFCGRAYQHSPSRNLCNSFSSQLVAVAYNDA